MSKLMADSGNRIRVLWFSTGGDIPHTCPLQNVKASSDTKCSRHWQNQEKEEKTPTTDLSNFFSIFFRQKVNDITALSKCFSL